ITLLWPANTVKIQGSGSDPDGTIASYLWSKVAGPEATMTDANTPAVTLTGLSLGSYVLRLTVTDDKGGKHSDDVTVVVKDPVAPVANAGPDLLLLLPTNTVVIQGTATDSDGTIVSYKWTQRSGPVSSMTGITSPTLNVSALISGTYKFRLTVTDDSGLSDYDDTLVRVTQPPQVDAGLDQTVFLPQSQVTFNGSASDADGTITKYRWNKYSGPGVVLVNATTPNLTVTGLKEGTHIFMLRVTDNSYATATDYVTLTVKKELVSTDFQTSGNSEIAENTLSVAETPLAPVRNSQAILNKLTSLDLEDCLVTIFNDTGDRIFSGNWSSETYRDIFTDDGLYLYQIIKKDKRINAGKIYIRR
ncbi:MAG: PKD domain-containing protein, partial [Cyclobacteriaceae bacterium]